MRQLRQNMSKTDKNYLAKDHLEMTTNAILQNVLSFIPGGPIFDSFWNYRKNLKQKRIIDFSESVKTAMEQISNKELHSSNFETDDFVDIIETIYMKVQNTRSNLKLEKFKNILINQIIDPHKETPLFMKFINLIDELDDLQIIILNDFREWERRNQKINNIIIAYMGHEGIKYKDEHKISRFSKTLNKDVTKAEIEYFANDLVTKHLIINDSITLTSFERTSQQNDYKISPIGKSFLEFIENN